MPSHRDVWMPMALRDWTADVRFAFRVMWRQQWFAAAAVVTLGLAIGIGNTVYTVVNAMILRGLPVAHPDRIVMFTDGTVAFAFFVFTRKLANRAAAAFQRELDDNSRREPSQRD